MDKKLMTIGELIEYLKENGCMFFAKSNDPPSAFPAFKPVIDELWTIDKLKSYYEPAEDDKQDVFWVVDEQDDSWGKRIEVAEYKGMAKGSEKLGSGVSLFFVLNSFNKQLNNRKNVIKEVMEDIKEKEDMWTLPS